MTEPWDQVLASLSDRDKLEKADSEYYRAFSQLSRLRATTGDPNSDRLIRENSHLWDENELLTARLNSQTLKLEIAGEESKKLRATIKTMESKISKLEKKVGQLGDQLAEKNRSFDILNDEHLISNIQQNVLHDKVAELEKSLAALKS